MALVAQFNEMLDVDPELAGYIASEEARQQGMITLIASENYADPVTMELKGSVCTNKYAKGYQGKREYMILIKMLS